MERVNDKEVWDGVEIRLLKAIGQAMNFKYVVSQNGYIKNFFCLDFLFSHQQMEQSGDLL